MLKLRGCLRGGSEIAREMAGAILRPLDQFTARESRPGKPVLRAIFQTQSVCQRRERSVEFEGGVVLQ